jgi:DNA-binding beta-propeller fold protein YncE
LLEAGSRLVFATDSEVHIVNKTVLNQNRNSTLCLPFDLTNQIIFGFFVQIDCGVGDVIYNATQHVVYATLPSYSGVNGNSIARIDAATGQILNSEYVGSEPRRMVITADDMRAYITLGESNRVAVVNLSGGTETLEGYVNLRAYTSGAPMFAEAVAVSPDNNDLILVGAPAHLSAYSSGTRLTNFLSANNNIGNPKDIFFADPDSAIAQVQDGTISRISVSASGVGLNSQTPGAAVSGSLKVQDGKIYDHDGRVLDATSLAEMSLCAVGVGVPGLLVDKSQVSNLIYYVDQSVDSLFSVCTEGNSSPSSTATVPAFGDIGAMPQDLEEMGDNRVALSAGDTLLLFEADSLN